MKLSKEAVGNLLERVGIRGITDTLLPLPENVFDLESDNPDLKENILWVYPQKLEDIRLLVGSSLADGETYKAQLNLPEQIIESCKNLKSSDVNTVDYDVLQDVANRIIHFPCNEVDELIQSNAVYKKAAEEIIKAAKAVPVLAGSDLVVKNGEIYTVSVPTAIFNSITIYGTGSIKFNASQVKLVANVFNYYPNQKGGN